MSMRPGLCSITYRRLSAAQVVLAAASAGLEAIEWGGDVHVPPGDVVQAAGIARMTADAGLAVSSYGSYWRGEGDFRPVLDAATALGADRIRVWAGRIGSADADAGDRARITGALADAVEQAAACGVLVALEYHGGTLADGPGAVRRLQDDVPGLGTYWQPSVGVPAAAALAEYAEIAERVAAVHVFSWWPTVERRRLHERDDLWGPLFRRAQEPRDALIEFVPDDDPALLAAEAETLRRWIADAADCGD